MEILVCVRVFFWGLCLREGESRRLGFIVFEKSRYRRSGVSSAFLIKIRGEGVLAGRSKLQPEVYVIINFLPCLHGEIFLYSRRAKEGGSLSRQSTVIRFRNSLRVRATRDNEKILSPFFLSPPNGVKPSDPKTSSAPSADRVFSINS